MYLTSSIKSLLTLLVLIPALSFAGEHGDMNKDRKDRGDHMEHMAEKLGLDESQRQQWRALHQGYHPRMMEIHEAMKEQRQALHKASKDGFDEAQAQSAADRLGELTSEASIMRARMHAEVREILTEEQLEKFDKYYDEAERHDKHHKKGEGMMHHQGGHQGKKDDKQHH